jgi:hypothetical protein
LYYYYKKKRAGPEKTQDIIVNLIASTVIIPRNKGKAFFCGFVDHIF